jgi:cell division protein FtsB
MKKLWAEGTTHQVQIALKIFADHGLACQTGNNGGTQYFNINSDITLDQSVFRAHAETLKPPSEQTYDEDEPPKPPPAQPAGVAQHVDPATFDDTATLSKEMQKKMAEDVKRLQETGTLSPEAQKKLAEQQVDPALATETKALQALVAQLQHDNSRLRQTATEMLSEIGDLETENKNLAQQARLTSGNMANDGSMEIEDADDGPNDPVANPPPNNNVAQQAPTAPILLPAKGTAPAPPAGGGAPPAGGGRPPNPPVNNNEVQATALVEAQTNAVLPTQTTASLDEKEGVLKDEHASKRQKQLGYNPKINWYGTEVQWGAIIKKLDDLPWHYPDPFDTNIRPWSPSQLDAVDPFL